MKKSKEKSKGENTLTAYYIELKGISDFAGQNFDYPGGHIKAVKEGSKYRLMSMGEKIGDIRLIYYVTVDKIGKFFVYNPTESLGNYEMKDQIITEQGNFKSLRAPIIELLTNPYKEAKELKKVDKVRCIEIKDSGTLIRSMLNSHEDDSPPKLYAFFDKTSHIIGTFELFHESGAKIFTYSRTDIKSVFGSLSYNYMNDTVEPSDSFNKSAVYVRVINLSKPFPFF